MREQPAWNPLASLAWRTEWHRAGYRRIIDHPGEYHGYMVDRATAALAMSDVELRRRLWP